MNLDIQKSLSDLQSRLQKLEEKTRGIQPNAFLNQYSMDPQSASFLQDFATLPYDTVAPTSVPNKNGYQRIVKTGGLYYLYIYLDGAWRRTQLI